jgi:hypothetical protein
MNSGTGGVSALAHELGHLRLGQAHPELHRPTVGGRGRGRGGGEGEVGGGAANYCKN